MCSNPLLKSSLNGKEHASARPSVDSTIEPKSRLGQLLGEESGRYLIQELIDQIPDFLFVKDTQSKFVVANWAITHAYGLPRDGLIGKTDYDLHPTHRADNFFRLEQEIVQSGVPLVNVSESFPDHRGQDRWYSTTKAPLRSSEGEIVGLIGVARDVTERRRADFFELQQSNILELIATNAPLATVLEHLALSTESQLTKVVCSILILDVEVGCLRHGAAPSLPEAYNRAIDGVVIGPNVGSCGTAAHRRESVFVSDIRSDPLWNGFKELAEDFSLRSCWSTPVISHDGPVLGTFALYSADVRSPDSDEIRVIQAASRLAGIAIERHRSEEQLLHMAHHDGLTGLPNRVLCLIRLKIALAQRSIEKHHIALHFVDLDGFKQVNDTLGHHIGDGLLKEVGSRLQRAIPSDHTVARLGGDEFAVIQNLSLRGGREESATLANDIVAALSLPFQVGDHRIVAGASIGIAIAPEDDDDPEALLRDADLALYRAKADERGGVRFFEPEMNLRALQRSVLEIDLRQALERSEFEVYYQPIISLDDNRICGFEALLRWNHPQRGLVGPAEFIPVAEEIGLIVPIGDWVLRNACIEAALWPSNVKLAVNLSPVQFKHEGLFQTVSAALMLSGLPPERLELEITESVILLDNEANLALLHDLRRIGASISLDDFGTGYSSLSYLDLSRSLKSKSTGRLSRS